MTSRTVELSAGTVAYSDVGDGSPLVFVHGWVPKRGVDPTLTRSWMKPLRTSAAICREVRSFWGQKRVGTLRVLGPETDSLGRDRHAAQHVVGDRLLAVDGHR